MLQRVVTLRRRGGSIVLAIPPDWIRRHQLEPGARVMVEYDEKEVRIRAAML